MVLTALSKYTIPLKPSLSGRLFSIPPRQGSDIWDIIKYKIAKKVVDKDQDFLMVFGGSSVTAGHDNYFHQSYPMVSMYS
jgi:hypothetical protein